MQKCLHSLTITSLLPPKSLLKRDVTKTNWSVSIQNYKIHRIISISTIFAVKLFLVAADMWKFHGVHSSEMLSIWDKQSIIISFVFGREKWMSKSCRTVWVGQNFRTNWIVWRRAYNFPPLACAALPCHEVPWGGLPKKWSNWNSEELERSTGPNLEGEIVSKPVLHRHKKKFQIRRRIGYFAELISLTL